MHVRNGLIAAAFAGLVLSGAVRLGAQPPASPAPPAQKPPAGAPPAGQVQTPATGEHGQAPPAAPAPAAPQGPGGPGGPGGGQPTRPRPGQARFPAHQRPAADPAVVARGRAVYSGACAACHGADARGGQLGGVNLLRSQLVLNDQDAELIGPVVLNGRPGTQMPPIAMSDTDLKAIASFLHDLQAKGSNQGGPPPGEAPVLNVLVGDATAGAAYFASRCGSCHSPTGDLQGIGTRIADAKVLQNVWVSGGRAQARAPGSGSQRSVVTAAVVLASGEKVEGRLVRLDDFLVTVALADGTQRSFRRTGDDPKVQINDPLVAHRELLAAYTDKNMHDVTAYLASLK